MDKNKLPVVARRMADIQPFYVMDLLARAKKLEAEGQSIIHMEVGEPDFDTPKPIIKAAQNALNCGLTHYTPALGLPELREAIAQHYQSIVGGSVDPGRIIITPGASGALLLVMGLLVNPGDEVLMADPGYPCNRHFVRLMEGKSVGIPVDRATGYQLTIEGLEKHWSDKTKAVMIASPSNPTGTLIIKEQLREIVEFVRQRGGFVIIDEIYQGIIYEGEVSSGIDIEGPVFIVNSFSKYFNMTGWRLGWLVADETYVGELDKLAQNIYLAAPTVAQYAALAAFDSQTLSILDNNRKILKQRRDYLLPALKNLGFDIPVTPAGAFYLYANCSALTKDSLQFCHSLLYRAGVAITPGNDFGDNRPAQHLRYSYTTSMDNLVEAVSRIKSFVS